MKQAIHFGGGNIGRGFIGELLVRSGYEVTFVDVAEALVDEINKRRSYDIEVVGNDPKIIHVEHVKAINSNTNLEDLLDAFVTADIVTTATGPPTPIRTGPGWERPAGCSGASACCWLVAADMRISSLALQEGLSGHEHAGPLALVPHLADLDPGRGCPQIHLVKAPDPPDRGADVAAHRGDGALTGVLPQGDGPNGVLRQ